MLQAECTSDQYGDTIIQRLLQITGTANKAAAISVWAHFRSVNSSLEDMPEDVESPSASQGQRVAALQ